MKELASSVIVALLAFRGARPRAAKTYNRFSRQRSRVVEKNGGGEFLQNRRSVAVDFSEYDDLHTQPPRRSRSSDAVETLERLGPPQSKPASIAFRLQRAGEVF
jgi:hypothetical protein